MTPEQPRPDAGGGDPLVRTMLQKLPVPAHHPEFWEVLQAQLARAGPPETVTASSLDEAAPPEQVPAASADADLFPSGVAGRRRPRASSVVMGAMAATTAVVVALAGAALLRSEDAPVDTAGRTGAPEVDSQGVVVPPRAGEVTGTTAKAADGTGTGNGDDPVEDMAYVAAPSSAREATTSFLVAVDEGDVDGAWALLGPASQEHWGSKERFGSSLGDLAEGGYGSFRWGRNLTISSVVLSSTGSGEAGVVVLDGVVGNEGDERRRALAVPYRYRADAGRWLLEPWGTEAGWAGEGIRFRSPAAEPEDPAGSGGDAGGDAASAWATLDARDSIEVVVPTWVETVTVLVDGTELASVAPGPGGRVSVTPSAPFAPGPHLLTVAGLGPEGIVAAAVLFRVP